MAEDMSFVELQEIVSICLDEIVTLKQENDRLQKQLGKVSASMADLVKAIRFEHCEVENLKYELNDPTANLSEVYYPKFYDIEDSVEKLVQGCSMARFGDGEFDIMSGNEIRQKFQHSDANLALRLKDVMQSDEEGLLIGIADNYGNLDKYNEGGRRGIRFYMTDAVRRQHEKFLDYGRTYHNAYISRPYALFADNQTDAPRKRFDNLKRIWDGRKVIFIEGELTRLGVGNDLFDNAAQIRRIEAPAENAYSKYQEILASALKYAEKDTLFLIALGPTAGILAYDLYHAGYQAIDIGHLDLEYEWFLRGMGERCEVKNKYNNELPQGNIVEEICDEKYLKEILCKV